MFRDIGNGIGATSQKNYGGRMENLDELTKAIAVALTAIAALASAITVVVKKCKNKKTKEKIK
jgi:hypothetical protein